MLAVPPLFGRFLVKTGKADEDEIRAAIRLQLEIAGSLLEQALLAGVLTLEQARAIKQRQRQTGEHLDVAIVALGFLDADAVDRLHREHERSLLLLGEALVVRGVVTEADLTRYLEEFSRYRDN